MEIRTLFSMCLVAMDIFVLNQVSAHPRWNTDDDIVRGEDHPPSWLVLVLWVESNITCECREKEDQKRCAGEGPPHRNITSLDLAQAHSQEGSSQSDSSFIRAVD